MADLAHKCSEIAAVPSCGRELLLAVRNISKCYGRTTAVAGVTLTLWAGEICGFAAPMAPARPPLFACLRGS
jgi:ABC-type branched-subunit amino acid transport system ATPase component